MRKKIIEKDGFIYTISQHRWKIPNLDVELDNTNDTFLCKLILVPIFDQDDQPFWIKWHRDSEGENLMGEMFCHSNSLADIAIECNATVSNFSDFSISQGTFQRVSAKNGYSMKYSVYTIVNETADLDFVVCVRTISAQSQLEKCLDCVARSDQIDRKRMRRFSDFVLECEGKNFAVHKMVLASNSDVFEKMFDQNRFKEATTGKALIKEMSSKTLGTLLELMYSQTLPKDLSAQELLLVLQACDRYNVEKQKWLVVTQLIDDHLGIETCCQFLLAGLQYGCKELIEVSKTRILQCINIICTSEDFTKLMASHPNALEMN